MADVPLRGEEGRYRGVPKIFQTGRDFSGAGGAVESGRSDGMPRASPSCPPANAPGFLRPLALRGGLRKPGSILLNEKDFLPIGGWAAKWYGNGEG